MVHCIAEAGFNRSNLEAFEARGRAPTVVPTTEPLPSRRRSPSGSDEEEGQAHVQGSSGEEAGRSAFFADLARRLAPRGADVAISGAALGPLIMKFVQRKDLEFSANERRSVVGHMLKAITLVATRLPKEVSAEDRRMVQQVRVLAASPVSDFADAALYGAASVAAPTLSRLFALSMKFTSSDDEAVRLMEVVRRANADPDQVDVAASIATAARALVPELPQVVAARPTTAPWPQRGRGKRGPPSKGAARTQPPPKRAAVEGVPSCTVCKRRGHTANNCWQLHPEKRPQQALSGQRS